MDFKLEDASAAEFRMIWDNNGRYGPDAGDTIKLEDALSVPNASMLFPKVMSSIIREAQEPLLVATQLLQRINYSYGQTITFPAVGALVAADIAEGEEYPERSLQMGGASVTATIGKSGLAIKVTDEMIRYSQFDVIGMHLRAAGRALARHKEVKCFNYIRSMGTPVFDNLDPSSSVLGVTTGRDLEGSANGAVTMDDIFDGFAHVLSQGFMADTLLMHPLAWTMWVKDAQLRAFVQANGGGVYFANWTGNPYARAPWDAANQGGLGISAGQRILPGQTSNGAPVPNGQTGSNLLQYPQTLNSAPVLPSYMNVPFRIIVSPYVPYDPRRKLTDIYMFDSNELGVLIVDEDLTMEEFDDQKVDIRKIKMRERYAIGILNEGLAISVFRNVHVVPNEVVMPAQAHLDVSGNIQKIAPDTNLNL